MFDFMAIGPVIHIPAGTFRVPPPLAARASIALAKASVLRVLPSATAPKSVRLTVFAGNMGLSMTGMSNGRPS